MVLQGVDGFTRVLKGTDRSATTYGIEGGNQKTRREKRISIILYAKRDHDAWHGQNQIIDIQNQTAPVNNSLPLPKVESIQALS